MKKLVVFFMLIPALVPAQIIFHDAFNDNSLKWFTGESGDNLFRIDSGYYHIESGGTTEAHPLDSVIKHAFYASCNARMQKGKAKASYGFYLQSLDKETDRKVFFVLNQAGLYSCFIQKPDGTFPLARWTPSPYIYTQSEWNTIALTGDSLKINLYINDFYIRSFDNPFFNYNYFGVTAFDSSAVDFNEVLVYSYDKLDKLFGIDYYNLPEVVEFLFKQQAEGFKKIKGKVKEDIKGSDKTFESQIWIPGSQENFIEGKSFKALFSSYTDLQSAQAEFYKLREKLLKSIPESDYNEGFDESTLPYAYIGKFVNGKVQPPYLDLFISANEVDGKSVYSIALEIN